MNTLSKTVIVATLGLLAAAPAFASHERDQGRDQKPVSTHLQHQDKRFEKGVKKHQLTRKEALQLKRQQRDISYLERVLRHNGQLSKRERRILKRELDRLNWQIKQLKHNDLGRYVDLHQRYGKQGFTHSL